MLRRYSFLLCLLLLLFSTAAQAQDSTCPLTPRLTLGQRGVVTPGNANNVRDTPTTSGTRLFQLAAGTQFEVLEGPVCADGFHWWRVSANGQTGWTVEGSGTDYFLAPLDSSVPSPAPASQGDGQCGLPTRLFAGQLAFINSSTPNRLRDQPSAAGAQIGQVFNDQNLQLLEGPVCNAGFTWWRVDYKGTVGWTVESSAQAYFLDGVAATPTPPPSATPRPSATPTLTPTPAYIGFANPVALAWSSDGARIIVATARDGLYLFDAISLGAPPVQLLAGTVIRDLAAHPTQPQLVALITDNPANDGDGYRVFLYDLDAQEEVDLISESPVRYAREPQFTADGSRLLLNENGKLTAYDFESNTVYSVATPFENMPFDASRNFSRVAISADGSTVAGAAILVRQEDEPANTIVLVGDYGADAFELIGIESVEIEDNDRALALNADATLLVLGDDRGNVRSWSLPDFTYNRFIRGERSTTSNAVNHIAILANNDIITGEGDPQAVVRIFRNPGMSQIRTYNAPDYESVRDLALHPSEGLLAVLLDDVVHVLRVEALTRIALLAPIRN